MKAFLAQINPVVGDLRSNFEKHVDIINIVNSKKDSNPKLIIFPELSLIGYPARDLLFKKELLRPKEVQIDPDFFRERHKQEMATALSRQPQ